MLGNPKDNYDMSASVFVVQFNGFMSLTSYFDVNLLETEFYIYILAHPVFKMGIIQEPHMVTLWNKRHFEEEKTEIMQHV